MTDICTSLSFGRPVLTSFFVFLFSFCHSQQISFQREISGYEKGHVQLSIGQNIDVDTDGNLLIHDSDYNLVYVVNTEGKVVHRLSYSKKRNYFGASVCFDKEKRIYVSSWHLKKIFIYDANGKFLNTISRADNWFGDIDTDDDGNIYVISNDGIHVYNKNRVFQYVIGEWGSGTNQLNSPKSLAVSGGKVYVSDKDRVHVYSTAGTYMFHFDFIGDAYGPGEIAIHPDGSIWVANSSQHRIDIFSPTGTSTGHLGTPGTADGTINYVLGLAIDNAGTIYQADNSTKIQMFSSDGAYIKKIGAAGNNTKEIFHFPTSIDFDKTGNLYVINHDRPRIKKVDRSGNVVSSFGADLFNQETFVSGWPTGICVTNENNIIVLDYTGPARVRMLDAEGDFKMDILDPSNPDTGTFSHVTFIETDEADNIYVLDGTWLNIFDKTGTYLRRFRVTQTSLSTLDLSEHNVFYTSVLAVDEARNIFVADPGGNQVIMYDDQGIFQRQFNATFPIAVVPDLSRKLLYIATEHHGIHVATYDGQYLATLETRSTPIGDYDLPMDLAIDPITRSLYILDARKYRVLEYKFANPQSVTFTALENRFYGEDPMVLMAAASSDLPVTYTSSNEEVAIIVDGKAVITGVGQTFITAKQPGNAEYFAATPKEQQLTVLKGNQSITFEPLEVRRYGDEPIAPDIECTSGLDVALASSDNEIAEIIDGKILIRKPGTVQITASHNGNDLYNAALPSSQTLTILKGEQIISFDPAGAKTYGDEPFMLKISSTSDLPLTITSENGNAIELDGKLVTIAGVGEITVTVSQEGNEYYDPAQPVSRTFTISKATQVISFEAISEKMLGDPDFALVATSTSSLPVSFVVDDETVLKLDGNQISIMNSGTTRITAVQSGNENYEPATPVSQTLVVNVLGVEERDKALTVFPNPTASFMTIETREPIQSIEIINEMGGSSAAKWSGNQIDLSQLKAGFYFLKIKAGSFIYFSKVVKH